MDDKARAVFEDRYGVGSFERLVDLLVQPCVTFAQIASRFGVTRERVRQWHQQWQPAAPTGHVRQRLCTQRRRRQALLKDPLVRTFIKTARTTFPAGRIQPISGHGGYRRRELLVDGRRVALRELSNGQRATTDHMRVRYRGSAEFVFVHIGADEFLFLPVGRPAALACYRNSFRAMIGPHEAVA